jgi:antitoxin HicB
MDTVDRYLNLNYRISLFRDDEGDFIAEVPELPGCSADGASPDEAVGNLKDSMRAWMESRLKSGLDVPEPAGNESFSGRLLLRMPKYLHRRLSQQAIDDGVSLNQYVVSLLSEGAARAVVAEVSRPVVVSDWRAFSLSRANSVLCGEAKAVILLSAWHGPQPQLYQAKAFDLWDVDVSQTVPVRVTSQGGEGKRAVTVASTKQYVV